MLLCSVRGCRLPLVREERRLFCASGHSVDVARSGYVICCSRRSAGRNCQATPRMQRGAAALHDRGVTSRFSGDRRLAVSREDGCRCRVRDGFYQPGASAGCAAHGVDIDTIGHRGASFPSANGSSLSGPSAAGSLFLGRARSPRMNASFRRVADDGRLLVAIPAPDDLIELRGAG